jgi:predicted AlkP superfamily pyrophosphatase or phosphodiesterase
MEKVRHTLESTQGKAYFFVYWNDVDATAHTHGPDTDEHIASIREISELMQHQLLPHLSQRVKDETVLLVSADHGHVNIKREDIINLNKFPQLEENFAKGPTGKKILPTGSPHDVFLFIRPEKRDEIVHFLQRELEGKARVTTTENALAEGLFGINSVSEKFKRRIGNVIILPRAGSHVWYEFLDAAPFNMLGIHGGLSEQEMIVPFAISPVASL